MPTSWMDTVLRLSVAALRELMEPRGFVLHRWGGQELARRRAVQAHPDPVSGVGGLH